jgi:hypothetical protein
MGAKRDGKTPKKPVVTDKTVPKPIRDPRISKQQDRDDRPQKPF